jgi:hypothetical protein
MLRDERAQLGVERAGWARLPAFEPDLVARLRALAREADANIVRHSLSSTVGFDELWGDADETARRQVQARIGALLAPFLERAFQDVRPVLYNFFVKRARSPGSGVRYHQDPALLDERGGDVALQLWIPLDDVTPENGALIVVEGSHHDATPVRPHCYIHPLVDHSLTDPPPGGVLLPLRAGEGVVFTNRTLHGSPPNTSAADRLAIGCIVVSRESRLVQWVSRSPDRFDLWSFSDEDLLAFHPGRFPESARLLETIDAPP